MGATSRWRSLLLSLLALGICASPAAAATGVNIDPLSGTAARATVTLSASATSDSASFSSFEILVTPTSPAFSIAGQVLGAPSSWTASATGDWNTTTVPDGVYNIVARATTDTDGVVESSPLLVTVDNTAPTAAFSSGPGEGDTVDSTAIASWEIGAGDSGGSGIQSVDCTLDTAPFTCDAAKLEIAANSLADGPHTITVSATDLAGNTSTLETRHFTAAAPTPTHAVRSIDLERRPFERASFIRFSVACSVRSCASLTGPPRASS